MLEGDDIITVPDTFFAEFGTLVPGDVIQGELQIDNRSGRPEDVYWKLETEEELLGTGGTLGRKGRWYGSLPRKSFGTILGAICFPLKRMNKMRKKKILILSPFSGRHG